MSSKQPTNYEHFREATKLALDAEGSEETETVLETLDEAIANNADLLEYPGDEEYDRPYSARIDHEGGEDKETGIVDHYHQGQRLIVEFVCGSTKEYLYGTIVEIVSG